ncbi:MAG: glycerophosphodiester phosphodiesterase [Candidatus Heimdallarchaeota archaeon]|nr:glycerophosphodiester phosphodiesterase [Candidatus Heimdallarchaeota archaeon]
MSNYNYPLIIAHRGASESAYENTMKAFDLAVKQKADMIELDTHLTSDGFFIVHHDPVIHINDTEYPIINTKLETIQELTLPSGDSIPLLEDVLKSFLPKIMFNIEIKCSVTKNQFDDFLVDMGGDTNRIVMSTFLSDVIFELQDSSLEYALAFLFVLPPRKGKMMAKKPFVTAINPYYRLLTTSHVNYYHNLGKKVYPWTVNSEKDIQKMVKKNVDGIITDRPKETREVIEKFLKNDCS